MGKRTKRECASVLSHDAAVGPAHQLVVCNGSTAVDGEPGAAACCFTVNVPT